MVTRACLRYAREGQNVTQAGPKCHTSRAKMSHKGQNITQSCYNWWHDMLNHEVDHNLKWWCSANVCIFWFRLAEGAVILGTSFSILSIFFCDKSPDFYHPCYKYFIWWTFESPVLFMYGSNHFTTSPMEDIVWCVKNKFFVCRFHHPTIDLLFYICFNKLPAVPCKLIILFSILGLWNSIYCSINQGVRGWLGFRSQCGIVQLKWQLW